MIILRITRYKEIMDRHKRWSARWILYCENRENIKLKYMAFIQIVAAEYNLANENIFPFWNLNN